MDKTTSQALTEVENRSKQSPSPLHHTFLLRRVRFTAQPLSALVRTLASRQCGPGSNPGVDTICGLSLLLVLSLAPRDFSNDSFSLSSKTNTCKFQFDQVDEEPARGSATSKSLFIIYSLFKWKWVLFSLYRHPTQMIANQYNVILKIPL